MTTGNGELQRPRRHSADADGVTLSVGGLFRLGPIDIVDDSLHPQVPRFRGGVCLSPTAARFQPSLRHAPTLAIGLLFHRCETR
jgi:hypothetical protein